MRESSHVRKLERAYHTAFRRELRAVDALPDHGASQAAIDRCWRLAAATNAAMAALRAARGEA